jgi:hypothetical protein
LGYLLHPTRYFHLNWGEAIFNCFSKITINTDLARKSPELERTIAQFAIGQLKNQPNLVDCRENAPETKFWLDTKMRRTWPCPAANKASGFSRLGDGRKTIPSSRLPR